MHKTIPLSVIRKGYLKLNLTLLPLSLLLLGYLSIMGGGAPIAGLVAGKGVAR